MDIGADIIEPAGFAMTGKALRRAGMDYLEKLDMIRHASFSRFLEHRSTRPGRLILLTTKAKTPYTSYNFTPDDTLLLGRESAGAPEYVHEAADARIIIPMRAQMRSLNIAVSAAMVLGEALRQTNGFAA